MALNVVMVDREREGRICVRLGGGHLPSSLREGEGCCSTGHAQRSAGPWGWAGLLSFMLPLIERGGHSVPCKMACSMEHMALVASTGQSGATGPFFGDSKNSSFVFDR